MLYEDIRSDEDFHFEKLSVIYEINFSGKKEELYHFF